MKEEIIMKFGITNRFFIV